MPLPPPVVLLRHGQSQWNLENRFTGWVDIDLTEAGREEARQAVLLLKEHGFAFDQAFTSVLKRAIRTCWIALDSLDTSGCRCTMTGDSTNAITVHLRV